MFCLYKKKKRVKENSIEIYSIIKIACKNIKKSQLYLKKKYLGIKSSLNKKFFDVSRFYFRLLTFRNLQNEKIPSSRCQIEFLCCEYLMSGFLYHKNVNRSKEKFSYKNYFTFATSRSIAGESSHRVITLKALETQNIINFIGKMNGMLEKILEGSCKHLRSFHFSFSFFFSLGGIIALQRSEIESSHRHQHPIHLPFFIVLFNYLLLLFTSTLHLGMNIDGNGLRDFRWNYLMMFTQRINYFLRIGTLFEKQQ